MHNYLTLRNFKYFDLNLTLFNIYRYQKKMKLNLVHLNVLNLISSSLIQENVMLIDRTNRLFHWDDIVDVVALDVYPDVNLLQTQIFSFLRAFLFKQINSSLFLTKELNVVSLPSKKQIFTLLRSPHTDKKSREQFRKREYKKVIKMTVLFSDSFLNFLIKKECVTSKMRSRYVDQS